MLANRPLMSQKLVTFSPFSSNLEEYCKTVGRSGEKLECRVQGVECRVRVRGSNYPLPGDGDNYAARRYRIRRQFQLCADSWSSVPGSWLSLDRLGTLSFVEGLAPGS